MTLTANRREPTDRKQSERSGGAAWCGVAAGRQQTVATGTVRTGAGCGVGTCSEALFASPTSTPLDRRTDTQPTVGTAGMSRSQVNTSADCQMARDAHECGSALERKTQSQVNHGRAQ
ncbi:uncharacterized protein LOC143298655 [Babylonia areolata]|uniref:uncharacterized protein LOC143298655 n=1 Tax=Babylonia areolata TaxID=304850 RepID=UPI003FD609AF